MAKFCPKCGRQLGEGNKFCPGCGSPVPGVSGVGQPGGSKEKKTEPDLEPVRAAASNQKKVIGICVIAAVAVAVLIFAGTKLFGGGYKTPFENLEKAINHADVDAMQEIFVPEYTDKLTDAFEDEDEWQESLKKNTKDYKISCEVKNKEDIGEDEMEETLNEYASGWERYVDEEEISACCLLKVKMTSVKDGEEDTRTWKNVPVVKVDGDWYIMPGSVWMFGL